MAIKGLRRPYVAKYQNNGDGTVSYSDGMAAEKAVSYSVSIEMSENNPLYGDDEIAENDKGDFQSGEITLGTTDLPFELSQLILGAKKVELKMGEETVEEGVYDNDRKSPDLGFGVIEVHQINDIDKYRAVLLPKVYFNIPEYAAETKGESIEWQTPEITGAINKSDQADENYKRPWMRDAWFDSEEKADAYLKQVLNIKPVAEVKAKTSAAGGK